MLGGQAGNVFAAGFMNYDGIRAGGSVSYDIVARNGIAPFCDDKFRRIAVFRIRISDKQCILFVGLEGLGELNVPKLQHLAHRILTQNFIYTVEIDDAGPQLAIKFVLVAAFVGRQYFPENACAGSDAELLHASVEQFDTPFDVVFPRTFQVGSDGLFGFRRSHMVENCRR